MKEYLISTDSSCDFPKEFADKNNIKILIMPTILGNKEEYSIDNKSLFEYVQKTGELPKTAASGVHSYEDFFAKYSTEHKHIIHFSISDDLSASYKNAVAGSQKFKNVKVIDSRSLSSGIALQIMACMDDINAGLSYEKIVENAQKRVNFTKVSFVLEKLNYMRKGGRCSALTLLGANLLQIKPEIVVENGKMHVGKKFRGKMDSVLKDYISYILTDTSKTDFARAFVTYSSIPEGMAEYIMEQLKNAGFKQVYNAIASGTVSCHCGPNTIGILYLEKPD